MKFLKKLIVETIITIIVSLSITAGISRFYFNNNNINVQYTENKTYILNKNSKKIHVEECKSVKRMKNENKISEKNSISNLIKKHYSICKNCDAGIKSYSKRPFSIEELDKIYMQMQEQKIKKLPSKDEYLKSINTIGEWYIKHVATYQKILQEKTVKDMNEDLEKINYKVKYLNKYSLTNTEDITLNYKVITNNENITEFNDDTKILIANEDAVINYKNNFEKLDYKNIMFYPCDLLKDVKNNYKMPGDDCTRFMFTCLNYLNEDFINYYNKHAGKSWSKTNSDELTKNKKIESTMNKLGFDIYDEQKIVLNSSIDKNKNLEIKTIDENFKLEKGDILVRKGHVHFFLGNEMNEESENFGWGRVNYFYPNKASFRICKTTKGYAVRINDNEEETYCRVYRYIGEREEND